MMRKDQLFWAAAIGIGVVLTGGVTASRAQSYSIQLLGLNDAAHSNAGQELDYAGPVNDAGQIVGGAARYIDGNIAGDDAWFYSPSTHSTQIIGLLDAVHTSSIGERENNATILAPNGLVVGAAQRYSGTDQFGQDLWLFNPSTGVTQTISPTDAAHVATSGYAFSQITGRMTAGGQIAGYTDRFSGAASYGTDAWIYNIYTGASQLIGLTDPLHTAADGSRTNDSQFEFPTGLVVGSANRYSGGTSIGQDAWLYSPASNTTVQIGLNDSDHTQAGGYSNNGATLVNAAGQADGIAERYSGSTELGYDAWFYSPVTHSTQLIGLTDVIHTQATGYRSEEVGQINAAGQVVGSAYRFDNGYGDRGQDVWLYSPATNSTQVIGLLDAAHTESNGYRAEYGGAIDDAGQVSGTADRFNGATAEGTDAWFYSSASGTTKVIGLTDAAHLQTGGFSLNHIVESNSAGQVAGEAERFDGTTAEGYDAWFYDPQTGKTYDIEGDVSATGYADTEVEYLSSNGMVLGSYNDGTAAAPSYQHAFEWTEAGRLVDLGSLVSGGLTAAGWTELASVEGPNAGGEFVGEGNLIGYSSYGQESLLLTPVPEPSVEGLFITIAGTGLVRRRGR